VPDGQNIGRTASSFTPAIAHARHFTQNFINYRDRTISLSNMTFLSRSRLSASLLGIVVGAYSRLQHLSCISDADERQPASMMQRYASGTSQ